MKALFIILLAVCSIDLYSQVEQMEVKANDLTASGSMFRTFDNRFKDIEGYPTLLEIYYPGQVTLMSGNKVNHDSINFDVYHNDLLVKRGKLVMIISKAMVSGFSIKSPEKERNFTKLKDDVIGNDVFYEVLADGKVKLLKRVIKTISGPSVDDGYSTSRTHSIFVQKSKIYIKKENGELVELKSKKVLLSQFPGQAESITTFMKENKLNVKNEDELVKVIEFINTF